MEKRRFLLHFSITEWYNWPSFQLYLEAVGNSVGGLYCYAFKNDCFVVDKPFSVCPLCKKTSPLMQQTPPICCCTSVLYICSCSTFQRNYVWILQASTAVCRHKNLPGKQLVAVKQESRFTSETWMARHCIEKFLTFYMLSCWPTEM